MTKEKQLVSLWIKRDIAKDFQKNYPYCASRFLRNCLQKANESKEFFDDMFFGVRKDNGTKQSDIC